MEEMLSCCLLLIGSDMLLEDFLHLVYDFECQIYAFETIPLCRISTVRLVSFDRRHLVVEESDNIGIGFIGGDLLLSFRHHLLIKEIRCIYLKNVMMPFVYVWDDDVVSLQRCLLTV